MVSPHARRHDNRRGGSVESRVRRRMQGYAGHRDEPPTSFVRDWGSFLLFCGVGTCILLGALGWAGLIAFYGSLLLFGFVLWLPGFVRWRRARPLLLKAVSQLPPGDRRRLLAGFPPRERRKWKRRLAKRRVAEHCTGPGPETVLVIRALVVGHCL